MDKMLYIAASGASQDLLASAVRANNLANAQTTGFKAMMEQARAMPAFGDGLPTRVFAMTESPANRYDPGAMVQTNRDLDIAVEGNGWFAVLDKNGGEAYSRNGSLQMGTNGELLDTRGNQIVGEAGPIFLPIPLSNVNVAQDGTISVRPQGAPANVLEPVGRIKLVKPDLNNLERSQDGLFRLPDGEQADQDLTVGIRTGFLEASNVNPIEEMMGIIQSQRHYEMQVKFMKQAEEIDERGTRLMMIM
ncbi:flagellar basal body rod protein FlgF [Planctobacterium marinum]|uniref:flagellar basal body rod protein FlgF n=1 Tax=Planctobacterium marinum TaxID=1631968 RepID=UPI001E60924E|nr:flagellar basal body rod protein FlgF [Planctobacterium marinum]MCC2606280.1 flagellar basal body rod protein FlgF [Planctobacterium marinum]